MDKILFHSTRGQCPMVDIRKAALTGLAPDGGLYLPHAWPHFSLSDISAMRSMSYQEIALTVLTPFFKGALPEEELREIIKKAYADFDHPEVTPLRRLDHNLYLLELFHGPTWAFKDIAMQFLGLVFERFMKEARQKLTVIGATSGDTGSAAIVALAGRSDIDLYILYPAQGLSEIQRRQMTTVMAPNVRAIAVEGTFDACQTIVKDVCADEALRKEWNLTTVNSINILRILAQMVYYFYAATRLDAPPSFVVPTGNFGDIFAGYAALQCGLPIAKLVVASNSNDILPRFFASGQMRSSAVRSTLSPSMDIQISSNFERLIFDMVGRDPDKVRKLMSDLRLSGSFTLDLNQVGPIKELFRAGRADDMQTVATMAQIDRRFGTVIDPHTAVGVDVALELSDELPKPLVVLATAHAAKFPETVNQIGSKILDYNDKIVFLLNAPERS